MERYIAIVLGRRWLMTLLACLVMVALAAGSDRLTVSDSMRASLSEDNPQLAAFEAFEATYSESNMALIAIAPREGSVFTRETLGAIEALTEAARRAPHAIRVDSPTSYNHTEASGDDLVVAPLVDDARSLTDADLARIERIALNADDLAGLLVSPDGRVAGLAINFATSENGKDVVFEATDYLNAVLDEARKSHPDIAYYLVGDIVYNRALVDEKNETLQTLFPIAFLVMVIGGAALLLRSALGTLAVVAVCAAFRSVGHALWTTTAILSTGFLVLALSGFEASWMLGLMVAITISLALLIDFLLLPPLLKAVDGGRS